MTHEERSKAIRAGQKIAWAEGKRWGYKFKGDLQQRERIAAAVELGEMSRRAGARELGISPTSLCMWMKRHGYKQKCVKNRLLLPTEREIRALGEYWARECTLIDVCQFTGHCYATVRRWIDAGYGKEQKNAE